MKGGKREREGKREGEGKEEGENNGWNATVTIKGKWERGAGTEGEEKGELTWVCYHSHGGTCREGSCTHSLTLQCILINTRCHHQQGHTDGGGVKGRGEGGTGLGGGGEGKHTM